MSTEQKTKVKICSLDPTSLYLGPLLRTSPMTCKKLASLVQDSHGVVFFSMVNGSSTILTPANPSQMNKLKLVLEHLDTCSNCKRSLERFVCPKKPGSGGKSGMTTTQPQSLKSQRHKRKDGTRRSRTRC